MNVLRVPPFPITITYDVPSNDDYLFTLKDTVIDEVVYSDTLTALGEKLIIELPLEICMYDESYAVEIYEYDTLELVVQDNLEISRPYVLPSELGTTASEIAEATYNERLARAIIDSITGGFYFKLKTIETSGLGLDYIPVWGGAYKVISVYENDSLIYDVESTTNEYEFKTLKDASAITKVVTTPYNRREAKPNFLPIASSDLHDIYGPAGVMFPEGYDYTLVVEQGYKVVPNDIKDATMMLINDISCGKLEHFKRNIKSYSTDQFKLEYGKGFSEGTGNLLVDKILSNYIPSVGKPGVL